MAREDIRMSSEELRRLHVIRKVIDGDLTHSDAGRAIGLCVRQIGRIVSRVRDWGDRGIIHKLRGAVSNSKFRDGFKEKVIGIYRERYSGFGPLLASEKLLEFEGISVSDETLRLWLIESGDWHKVRKRKTHRKWRERKSCFGEMVQMDGSHHDWFEGRGGKCVLMLYVDDATGYVFARFYDYEGTIPAMDSFRRYIEKYGIPTSIYFDNHSTYKSQRKLTIEEELEGKKEPLSEFGRALSELGVKMIHAGSPQGKGRAERQFKTFQDRVAKEMRLRGISNKDDGNEFLECYLPVYNERFGIELQNETNLHRGIPEGMGIDEILCIKTERVLRNDFTISYENNLYQIQETTIAKTVIVEKRISGELFITYKGKRLRYKEIRQKLKPIGKAISQPKKKYIPPPEHPWRNYAIKKTGR